MRLKVGSVTGVASEINGKYGAKANDGRQAVLPTGAGQEASVNW